MKSNYRKLAKSLAIWVVIGLVAYFFVRTLQRNWSNLQDLNLRPDVWTVLSIVCFVLSVVSSGILWGRIMNKLTHHVVPVREAIRIHLASWLLKYVPGQAGSFLNKIAWAKKRGIDGKKVTASFIYENAFLLLASVVPTVPILLVGLSDKFSEDVSLFVPLLISIPFVLVVVTPQFFSFMLNLLFKLLKKKKLPREELLSARDNLRFLLEFIIPRIINGAAFVLLAISVIGLDPSLYVTFGAIYVLAGIIGVLAIFVPSGLGVREAVITLFASAYIPTEQAIALALLARFYATISDVVVALLYVYLNQTEEKA